MRAGISGSVTVDIPGSVLVEPSLCPGMGYEVPVAHLVMLCGELEDSEEDEAWNSPVELG